ncbi:carboxylate--amine ligase/circularly permuted type 2 ATP-grasp protein [Microlunatus flavus]|uniref:Putative glutamate--cysteine ligase 2 n=1 Tax=Microlunatus flavus TaxID=1036181 RepID=A0A1H9F8J9_9ACTN|nr:carboxylate--amine ligase/circularly permuted type 2 ATP-grasp protein [Microlunatus flavus]SEQ34155.1 carboxylate-amine ligase [Microlunatus flavus]
MPAELTLGAEEELHLVDLDSQKLVGRAPQLLSRLPGENYSAEIQRTTVETNTEVVTTLDGLRAELLRLRRLLVSEAAKDNVGIAAAGTAPSAAFADFELTTTGRYGRMQEQYRMLVDEQLICGLQIHVGVSDRDLAVEIMQRVARDLPVLTALSASSPYFNEQDTGYSSIRTIIWQRWPTAGATGPLASAAEYDALLADLISSGVIADEKMAYFDVRPSSHAPTLELRVCDACPVVDDAILIAGLFRAAVRAAEIDVLEGRPHQPVPAPVHRAALWQAARGGLRGNLLDHSLHPRPVPAADAVWAMVERLSGPLAELGDADEVRWLAEATLARGNSADRQRAAYAERGRLTDVMELVVAETRGPAEGPRPAAPELRRYRSRAGDEAVGSDRRPRPAYEALVEVFRDLGADRIGERTRARDAWVDERGMTFGVDGTQQPFSVDLVPRIVSPHEWDDLVRGLGQRARAIEAFLRDVYGEQRIVRDGVLRPELVTGSPGWREEARRLPTGAVRAPVMGFDLVRNEFGGWRVLEDNVRNPSGAGYALAVRELLDAVMPDLPRPAGLQDPGAAMPLLRRALLGGEDAGTAALLSSGPGSSAWFEHALLAERAGLVLVTADDLEVADGTVRHRDGRRLDALYLRLDVELVDLVDAAGRPVGAEAFEVAVAGGVRLANAPGNGVADDKAMYCYVPELIGYYLEEHPVIESVPTYRTGDAAEYRVVLDRVGELVTKPVDGHGGAGVLIGPDASAAEVAARRAEIAANPAGWVAQEVVALSSHPTLAGSLLQPRHVDLRVFAYVTGTGPDDVVVAGLGLTRMAPEGSLVVNSSRGGGAKDTWVVLDPELDETRGER